MEPSFNPAVEAQAIGRVHRLGQKRNVEVIRLVMKNSVETRILTMLKKKFGDSGVEALVGSLQVDKTKVLAEEFDILYGVSGAPPKKEDDDGDLIMEDTDEDLIMEDVTSADF